MKREDRRSFLRKSAVAAGSAIWTPSSFSATGGRQYKAAVIGRTGGGDYGHGLDVIFHGIDGVTVAAVADENEEGMKKAAERSGAKRMYADYREMLEKEKPDLVSIAPRQPDCHRDMAMAAIEVGAHIYMEKPITEIPQEADDILDAANRRGVKISVAHTRRYMDHFLRIQRLLEDGYLGEILEFRFQGKQDPRVGGEDLIVLGSHDMDIMRFYLGDPLWCFAAVSVEGRDIRSEDVRQGLSEPYTVAGDTIRADYQFENNIQCRWSSVKARDWNRNIRLQDQTINKWGFDIFGTKRLLSYQESLGAFVSDAPFLASGESAAPWTPVEEIAAFEKPATLSHPIRNLIHAIETDGKPQCSGKDALWAVEMVHAVYHSQIAQARVSFPLEKRGHPLKDWSVREQ